MNPQYQDHPILRGVDRIWGPTDVYGIRDLPENAQVLVHGQVVDGMKSDDPPATGPKNDPMMPLVWVRTFTTRSGKPARVVATTMGASVDLESEGLRRLLVNACYWALGREEAIGPSSSVDYVGRYEPTFFGYNKFRRGVRPRDWALAP